MVEACRLRLALDFGAARGWYLAQGWPAAVVPFGMKTLAAGKVRPERGDRDYYGWCGSLLLDHRYFYRTADGTKRAAAIAAFLYGRSARAECLACAAEHGLRFEEPDYPRWHCPNKTTLIVFIGPAGRMPQQR